ncbi:MAG: Sulfatase [Planctomycetaceae bacterium]|nr:Sulfatase [Planctomycetaceae bacterium]
MIHQALSGGRPQRKTGSRRLQVPRRGFLQIGALGAFGLTLPDYLRQQAHAADSAPSKARSAILIFLSGGPSHHDTFDPKPDTPAEIRGEYSTIQTRVPGVQFASSVPLLAGQMHRLAIMRAVTHRDGSHESGVAYMQTGYSFRPGHNFPGMGAVVGFERQEQVRASGLAPYISLPDGRGGGSLGPSYNSFSIPGDPNDAAFQVPDITFPAGVTSNRLQRRRQFAEQFNDEFRRSRGADVQLAVDRFTAKSYDLILSPQAQGAFNLTQEDTRTRERYGRSQFGQRLLLARRLVEAGVPFLAATDFEWDDHSNIFPQLNRKLPVVDQGVSTLIADLDERGLLASTLVIVMGEFGRTPKINPMRGRDHWPNAFSVLMAGGGVKGGQIIGASDAEGAFPKERPVTPEDLYHSIYALLGIDPLKLLPTTGGREIEIVRDGEFIHELTS